VLFGCLKSNSVTDLAPENFVFERIKPVFETEDNYEMLLSLIPMGREKGLKLNHSSFAPLRIENIKQFSVDNQSDEN
jgi:hypothetical protein